MDNENPKIKSHPLYNKEARITAEGYIELEHFEYLLQTYDMLVIEKTKK